MDMLRKFGTLAVVAAMGFGTAASAETHIIMIMDDAFFPEISYVDDGDKIRFVNATTTSQSVVWGDWSDEDENDEDRWVIGPIAADDHYQININSSIELEFKNDDDREINGALSFSDPDL
jgi:plastocyanin